MTLREKIGSDRILSPYLYPGLTKERQHNYNNMCHFLTGEELKRKSRFDQIPVLRKAVSDFSGFMWGEIVGGSRKGDIVEAKHLFMSYACNRLGFTQDLAAESVRGKDHGNAYHAVKKSENTFHPFHKTYNRFCNFIETNNYGI